MTKITTPEQALIDLTNAETTLQGLQKQHADLIQHRDVLREEAAQIAHAALTEGGSARKRLDVINAEEIALDQRVVNLAAAVKTAQKILALAQRSLDHANEASKAEDAIRLADEYEALGQKAHDAFVVAFDALREAKACADKLRWVGGSYVTEFHVNSVVDAAIASYQIGSRHPSLIRGLSRPEQRHGLDEHFRAQAQRIRVLARKYFTDEGEAA